MDDQLLRVYPGFFAPANRHAAVQFCINAVIHNRQLRMLSDLLDPNSRLVEIGGDPGWTIEKRKSIASPDTYSLWPAGAMLRTYLDPDAYRVEFPECYSTDEEFMVCLRGLLIAYADRNPELVAEMPGVL